MRFQGTPGQEGADCGLGLQAGDDAKVRLDQPHDIPQADHVRCFRQPYPAATPARRLQIATLGEMSDDFHDM